MICRNALPDIIRAVFAVVAELTGENAVMDARNMRIAILPVVILMKRFLSWVSD